MAGIFGKIVGLESIREELKQRVNELLKAGEEWRKTADRLTAAIENLTAEIKSGRNPKNLRTIKADLRKLAAETRNLSNSFGKVYRIVEEVSEKI